MSAADSISLEEFILETMRIPQTTMCLDDLERLFLRLHLPDELIEEHTHFSKDSYCRSLICRTPRFDMLMLGWRPGQFSTIHDHLDSLNCTRVIHGELNQKLYRAVDEGEDRVLVELTEDERLDAGSTAHLDAWGIHEMGNASGENLVTLHIYSAPLAEITVYEPAKKAKNRLRLRYSLEDEFV